MKTAKAPTPPVTGYITTFTMLNETWKSTGNRRLILVLLTNHVKKKLVGNQLGKGKNS